MKKNVYNNSSVDTKDKYSKKIINNISNRIKSLENDIYKIKNKETLSYKKLIKYNINSNIDKNNRTLANKETRYKTKIKNKNSHKNFIKHYLLFSDNKSSNKYNTNNNSLSKKNSINIMKRQNSNSKNEIYKKINNYKFLIYEKKNLLLNMNSALHKRANTKNCIKDLSKISLSKNYEPSKNLYDNIFDYRANNQKNLLPSNYTNNNVNHFFSFSEINSSSNILSDTTEDNFQKINSNNNNNNNIKMKEDLGKLEYEFEIRHLKKKRKMLKKVKTEKMKKLNDMKKRNNLLENNIVETQNKCQSLVNNLMILYKQYIFQNKQNESLDSITNSNRSNTDEFSFKNIILNIMDIKYEFENNKLYNEFIQGINELLKITLLNIHNYNALNNNNIFDKINDLIDIKNNLKNSNNKYKYLLEESNIYLNYFNNLIHTLNLQDLNDLENFLQNIYMKNFEQNKKMKQIKNTLISDTSPNRLKRKENENLKRQISNQYVHSYNITLHNKENNYYKLKKKLICKNNYLKIRLKKNHFLNNKKIENAPKKLLNRTDKNDNLGNIGEKTFNSNNINNNKNPFDDNDKKNYYQFNFIKNDKKYRQNIPLYNNIKNKKIKSNTFENNKNNDIRDSFKNPNYYEKINLYNKKINQNNINRNDDDIKFINTEEEKKDGYAFKKQAFSHSKTYSAYNIKI